MRLPTSPRPPQATEGRVGLPPCGARNCRPHHGGLRTANRTATPTRITPHGTRTRAIRDAGAVNRTEVAGIGWAVAASDCAGGTDEAGESVADSKRVVVLASGN